MMTNESPTYLLDVNVLVALTKRNHVLYRRAHHWFAGVQSWATTPMTEAAFIRLMLNPLVSGMVLKRADVLAVLVALRRWPGHVFIADDSSLAQPVIDLCGLVGHKQVPDAHLVNLAAQHGAVLATLDGNIEKMLVPDDQKWVHIV